MIQLNNIHFTYPNGPRVLNGVTLEVRPNEILGVLGPNGSGKTTLLNLMLGLLQPNKGTVDLDDKSLTQLSRREIAMRLSHVAQHDGIELDFPVWDIVMMGRQPYQQLFGFDTASDRQHADRALHATETEALKNRSIQTLSGGERRRVLIARALAQDTPMLLLDEPTAHLDIHYQLEICKLLLRLRQEQERSIVVTLHDINLASLYCDRILLLSSGRIYGVGAPAEVVTEQAIREVFGVSVAVAHDENSGRPFYRMLRETP